MEKLQAVRGTRDLYGQDKLKMKKVIEVGSKVVERYGFEEIETPVFEFTEVFARNIGETTDIVTKEMYSFEKGGDHLTLRPEGTAGVVRAFVSNGMHRQLPLKAYYYGPMFRYERPQKGRYRQLTQFGAELLGVESPQVDVEVIAMAYNFLEDLGLTGKVTVEINSLGDEESRKAYREKLVSYLRGYYDKLSEDSKNRLEKNPLRVLDSKEECDKEIVANAPLYRDSWNESSRGFFEEVIKGLDNLGIKYVINDRLVRGLDYYNHTVFELTTDKLGSQGTVLAGGRYNGLVQQMGGGDVAGIGWAGGVDRLAMLIDEDVFVERPVALIPTGDDVDAKALVIAYNLRKAGIKVEHSYSGSFKKRFEKANKVNACKAIILGSDELRNNEVVIKDLDSGEQKTVALDKLIEELR
ncbi:MAG: histidine--tRNA ligase [Lactobacillaceae bacterium]|jgi:histidyl-tRNA synthetase|nr:histidine--tRNA ligase [Lactobacillaceae bacterium]